MSDHLEPRSSPTDENTWQVSNLERVETPSASPVDPSAQEMLGIYERVAKARPGTRDAEIFEKIRQWTFSDFSLPAHQFAGITREELHAWQKRNRINLSAGHIRPDPIDLQRGYAWGQIRMAAASNRLHSVVGPPSANEIKLSWSK